MALRGTRTRDELLRAAEYLFARQGVGGTRTKQIVERAGQGNDSAVQYHFGSRQGLLEAILGRHLSRMECQWLRSVVSLRESHELGPVVDAL
ncbi:MAG: TetR/AcrR family transcriptional regulator, partial [Mycobacteriaceae bacterium]